MKEARLPSPATRGSERFDDEITQPFRIVCERKPESGRHNSAEDFNRTGGREPKGTHKPIRAT